MIAPAFDSFFEVKGERAFEKKIGKQIYFGRLRCGNEREEEIRLFMNSYYTAKKNWDNFDRQFEKVYRIELEKYSGIFKNIHTAAVDQIGVLDMQSFDSDCLIHELTHLKYMAADKSLNKKWVEFSDNYYLGDYWPAASNAAMKKNGAVSYYALKSIEEDIAETARFVYIINNDSNKRIDMKEKKNSLDIIIRKEVMPKIKGKIKLLKDYDFISKKEYDNAIKNYSLLLSHDYSQRR